MITDKQKWHNLAVKHLSALLQGITLTNSGDYYRIKRLHSFRTEERKASKKV